MQRSDLVRLLGQTLVPCYSSLAVVYLAIVQDPFVNTTRGANAYLTEGQTIAGGDGSYVFSFLILRGKIRANVLTPEDVGLKSSVLVKSDAILKKFSLAVPTAQMSWVTIRFLLPVALAFVFFGELLAPMGGHHVGKQGAQYPCCHVRL